MHHNIELQTKHSTVFVWPWALQRNGSKMIRWHGIFVVVAFSCATMGKSGERILCPASVGGESALSDAEIVLLGEMHGNRETPAAFYSLVCHQSQSRRVVVGLEIPRSEQKSIDGFLASDGDVSARNTLLSGPFWTRGFKDGRSSQAMAQLIEELRKLRMRGAPVDVVALDVESDWKPSTDKQDERDAELAKAIAATHAQHQSSQLLAMMGNIHTKISKGTPWEPTYMPAAAKVLVENPGVKMLSLKATSVGGTTWACISTEPNVAPECKVWPQGGEKDTSPQGISMAIAPTDWSHGVLNVGAITASPPAAP